MGAWVPCFKKIMLELIQKLTDAITSRYPYDGTKPGLVLSRLNGKKYYASIVRYQSGTKMVICSAIDERMDTALLKAAREFASRTGKSKDPVDILRDYINLELR